MHCVVLSLSLSLSFSLPLPPPLSDNEAERMLESIVDLFEQKEKAETVSFEKKPEEPIFKKPRSIRKLNKKDISTPCNFKHVSGECECVTVCEW